MLKKKKKSFFERLTGTVKAEQDFEDYEDYEDQDEIENSSFSDEKNSLSINNYEEEASAGGELSVDVINTPNDIVIRAMVAGVKPQDLDVEISRDMVTITGTREEDTEIAEQDYYHRELYWGSFSRNILLPEEIDVEMAEAKEKHGLLEIKLPKIDKHKKTKLSVKSN